MTHVRFDQDVFEEILEKVASSGYIVPILNMNRDRYPTYKTWIKTWATAGTERGVAYEQAIQEYGLKIGFSTSQIVEQDIDPRVMGHKLNQAFWMAERLNRKQFGKAETITHQVDDQTKVVQLTDAQLIEAARPAIRSDEPVISGD